MALTEKNKLFIEEYVMQGYKGQADAWVKIYPDSTKESARRSAQRLLAKPEAKEYMRGLQKERFERLNVTAERIAEKLADMAFAGKEDDIYTPAIQQKALDLLQKQLGLQKQNINADVKQAVTIKIGVEGAEGDG